MRADLEKKKDEFMAKVEVMFEQLIGSMENADQPTLSQIEEAVLAFRRMVGKLAAEMIMEGQESRRPVPGPVCPKCHQEMRYKWSRGSTVETRLGPLEIERSYFYCEGCGGGFFPPGPATRVGGATLE